MQHRLWHPGSRLNVGTKIGLGYAFALGIVILSTISVFSLVRSHHDHLLEQEEHARHEVELLQRLQARVLQTRTHQQQLIPLVRSPEKFQAEYARMNEQNKHIHFVWGELKQFITTAPPHTKHAHQTQIPTFLQTQQHIPKRYSHALGHRIKQIRTLNLANPADVDKAQALLLEFSVSNEALEFDGISDTLVTLIEQAAQELTVIEASHDQTIRTAETVILTSMGLAIAMAVLIAILTSRAIAKPIEALTKIAHQSTKESNFDLQFPIERSDEIGTLAKAFNQLIASIKQLLKQQKIDNEQLELYSHALESKVQERTQELNDKNLQLHHLIETLQRTQVQMVQNEKMSALGQMVAGIAHEINNPVNFIHGNLSHVQEYASNLLNFIQVYQEHYPNPTETIQSEAENLDIEFIQEDLPKLVDSMQVGTDRIRQIVLSLRNFSRMDEAAFKAVDLHAGIDSTLLILQHRLKDKPDRPAIQVQREYGDLPLVECYPSQLNQAFMNILANAIDALDEANLARTYQEIKANPSQITIRTTLMDSTWVQIAIADNGTGMTDAVRQRIFEPFFTTKAIGKGTGLGMPITYQVITERHGGRLECRSTPGHGTEFIIQIPIQQPLADPLPHPAQPNGRSLECSR